MATNIYRHHHPLKMKAYKNIAQPLNLSLGGILLILTLLTMLGHEIFGLSIGPGQAAILGMSGMLSQWAGLSKKEKTAFVINLSVGIFFIIICAAMVIYKIFVVKNGRLVPDEMFAWIVPGLFHLDNKNILLPGILGLIFILNAWLWNFRTKKVLI